MAANAIQVDGYITESGELKIILPRDHPVGSVKVTIEAVVENSALTEEELAAMLNFKPVPADEIQTGGWEDMGIEDSVEYVEDLRRKESEGRGWQTYT